MTEYDDCACLGGCDCAERDDREILGAWEDRDEATTPKRFQLLAGTRDPSKEKAGPLPPFTGRPSPSAARPHPSGRAARPLHPDERRAREHTRPLSNAIGNVVPLHPRRTDPPPLEAA